MNRRARETVAVLVADLVDSTLVRSTLGRERADLLETALMASLHKIVTNNGGEIVRSTGDGLVSTFEALSASLGAAVSMQQTVERMVRGGRIADLDLRVGVALGDVAWADHGPMGLPMAQAARLEQEAGPGSIVCLDDLRHVLPPASPHLITSIGDRKLKGMFEPTLLGEVRWSPLPDGRPVRADFRGVQDSLPLVGRETELCQLLDLVAASRNEASFFSALVSGEAGVGKTRLLLELSRAPELSSTTVLYAPCHAQPHRAFGPIRAMLDAVIAQADGELLGYWAARDSALSVELPALAQRIKDLGEPLRASGEETRYRSIAALARFMSEMIHDQPVVLLIDDVQWIDNSSVEVLVALLQRHDLPLAVICTSDVDVDQLDERLVDALQHRAGGFSELTLDRLAEEQVTSIVRQALPSADGWIAKLIWEHTSGSPFAIDQMVENPGVSEQTGVASFDPSLFDVFEELDTGSRRFVEAAAVLGADADPWLAGEIAELDEHDMIAAAEVLERAGLMSVELAHRSLSLTFRHRLVADEVRRRLDRNERLALHRRTAEMLIERSVEPDASALARIATHLDQAEHLTNGDDCARAYLDAADATFLIGEFREVTRLASRGLGLVTADAPRLRARLLLAKASAYGLLLESADALAAGFEAAAIAMQLDDNRLLAAAAAIHLRPVRLDDRAAEWAEVCRTARARFDETVESSLRAFVLSNSLWAFDRGNDLDAATLESIRLADLDGSPDARIAAIYQRLVASVGSPFLDEQEQFLRRLQEIWEPVDWGCSYAGLLLVQAAHALGRGDRAALERLMDEIGRHVERAPMPMDVRWFERLQTLLALASGQWTESDRQLARPSRTRPAELEVTMFQSLWSMYEQGESHLVAPALADSSRGGSGPYLRAGYALMLADLGRVDEAHDVLRSFLPYTLENYVVGVHSAAAVIGPAATALDVVGDVNMASSLLEVAEPWEGQILSFPPVLLIGAADRFLGILASCVGDESRARSLFDSALDLEERFDAPPHVARTSFAYARSLHRWGDDGSAHHYRNKAAKIAEEFGMARLIVECAELL